MRPPPHPTDLAAVSAARLERRTPLLCAAGALALSVGAPAFCLLAGIAFISSQPAFFFLASWLAFASFLVGLWAIFAALWPQQPQT